MKRSKKHSTYNDEQADINESDLNFNDYEQEYEQDYEDDFDNFDDFDDLNDFKENTTNKKELKKEYYVKGADLIAEIKKYQDSKKTSKDGRGFVSEELRLNDFKNLY